MITTVGQVIINSVLPKDLRDYSRQLDAKGISALLDGVSKKYPEKYKFVSEALKHFGQKVSYLDGSSFSIDDFDPYVDRTELLQAAEELRKQKNVNIWDVSKRFIAIQKKLEDETKKKGLLINNSLAKIIASGSKGKPSQLVSTVTSPVMYADHKDRPIPVPVVHSLAEGLSPAEFAANSFGTRKGVYSTKFSTPVSGYFNKEVGFVTTDMLITEMDCGAGSGILSRSDDKESIGRVLAKGTGAYPAGTVITNKVLSDMMAKGTKDIIIRSPSTCHTKDGVCSKCYGTTEKGIFPDLGEPIGTSASSALTEPFTQGSMSAKHLGGIIGKSKNGIELIQQLLKIPKNFPLGATIAQEEGVVEKIEKAPQGGNFVYLNGYKHYVHPSNELKYKQGEYVEQGMPISSGIVNPAEVVKFRGIGEGRKILTDSLKEAYKDDGKGEVFKKHMEVLSRAMINHATIDDDFDFEDNLPGDVVTMSKIQKIYKPKNAMPVKTDKSIGYYLAKPYLHYTVGTKITPSVRDNIKMYEGNEIDVVEKKPPFTPMMVRMDDVPAYKDNWIERLYSIHLKQKLLESTARADTADIHTNHWVPSFIWGADFGKSKVKY